MIHRVNLDEAKQHLVDLIAAAIRGEDVFIENERQLVQLIPVTPGERERQFGSAKGMITMSDDFDAPLADFDEYAP